MKRKPVLIAAAIASVLALALPASASGTGDATGPRCSDLADASLSLKQKMLIADPDGETKPLPGVPEDGKWVGTFTVTTAVEPCPKDNAEYRVNLTLYGDTDGDPGHEITSTKPYTFVHVPGGSSEFVVTTQGTYKATRNIEFDENTETGWAGANLVDACHRTETYWRGSTNAGWRVTDASPDSGVICGLVNDTSNRNTYG